MGIPQQGRTIRVRPGPRPNQLIQDLPDGGGVGWVGWDAGAQPTISWEHIDGPYVHFRNGEMHWLTWRERWQASRGKIDAYDLEAKHRPHLAAAGIIFSPGPTAGCVRGDETTIHIVATMHTRWVPHFVGMLVEMQRLGTQGSSRTVSFASDGDGDFRPRFAWAAPYHVELAEPLVRTASGDTTFDAG